MSLSLSIPVVLSVGGFDSSGAAGVTADLITFAELGVHGAAATTVVTAQGANGIVALQPVSLDLILGQIHAVTADLAPTTAKLGLVGDPGNLEPIVAALRLGGVDTLVIDPVLVDGLDQPMVERAGMDAYRTAVRSARVITPNRREVGLLIGRPVHTVDDIVANVDAIAALGAGAVVVTGGRDVELEATDVVVVDGGATVWRASRLGTAKRRGTGCTLSAAIVAGLAHGLDALAAIDMARQVVRRHLGNAPTAQNTRRPGLSHLVSHLQADAE